MSTQGSVIVPEPAAVPERPTRTWGPMLLWTVVILAALGLTWFVGAVAMPWWQVRAIVKPGANTDYVGIWAAAEANRSGATDNLGGPASARRKLCVYLRLPPRLAPGRLTAVALLGYCDDGAVPVLLDIRSRSLGKEREEASLALANFNDPRVVEPLLELLEGASTSERGLGPIIRRLGEVGDLRALDPVLRLLADREGRDSDVYRWCSAAALGGLRDPRAVRPLLAAYSDNRADDRLVREAAYASLLRLAGPDFQCLLDPYSSGHEQRWALLRDPPVERLRDPVIFEFLLALLEKDLFGSRFCVALFLGCTGDPRAFEPLLAAARDEKWDQRDGAVDALASLDDPRAVEPLLVFLKDKDAKLRRAAAWGLGSVGGGVPRIAVALENALADPDMLVRVGAAWALVHNDPDKKNQQRMVPLLVKILAGGQFEPRGSAAWVLGSLGSEAAPAIPALERVLQDKDEHVRSAAAEAIRKIRGEAVQK